MTRHIAIIGAGPSGCFVAQALLKEHPEGLQVDVFDRLPVPFGLVRYGIAADHQGTKAISRQFERLFTRQGARFIGNAEVGETLGLEDVRSAYDAVVLATGLSGDRKLGIPGEELEGVTGSGQFTRALNEHPDSAGLPLLGPDVVVLGNGNVAIDIVRLIAKTPAELEGTDLGEAPTAWLAANRPRTITIVGRSAGVKARFDPVMVKELGKLAAAGFAVDDPGEAADETEARRADALRCLGERSGMPLIRFRFGLAPESLEGKDGRVACAKFRKADGSTEILPCTALISAIGFAHHGSPERPGPADAPLGSMEMAPGLFAAGWYYRGPRGTIPDNRADARLIAERISAWLARKRSDPPKPGLGGLQPAGPWVDYARWERIDARETAGLPEGRCRRKISSREAMLAIAGPKDE
ncbi:MAG: FAD-dependent oxidoreductase, partial [Rhizobiaceae bacterium]